MRTAKDFRPRHFMARAFCFAAQCNAPDNNGRKQLQRDAVLGYNRQHEFANKKLLGARTAHTPTDQTMTMSRLYGQAHRAAVTHKEMVLAGLPRHFDGLTVVFLTDLHCSAQTPPSFLERVMDESNRLKPDLILLGGDYITRGARFLEPLGELLAQLDAPLGKFGVLGNHDFETDIRRVRAMLARAGVIDLTNRGERITRQDARMVVAGVGDLWRDKQDLEAALANADADECVILLSHNPHYAKHIADPRVRLVLSGHTHGGQVQPPRAGAWYKRSRLGKFFVIGEVRYPSFQLYVSRGLGTVVLPFRYNCPPEITHLTLRTGAG